ncbi:tape measure protein [Pseudomonas resinovorans]|uniref:Tape measure protein n=1 Tax=Metapseudomonas resinovorans TaxID=53412 RepID=A0ABT4Y417_METRE|nr:tape measure protein [Pseudomonas resinovorans]MDA8483589.1 tape measure protein [Pseudomonas resinovorans]
MQQMKTSIVVDLDGNLTERAERFSRALSGMALAGQRSLQSLSGAVSNASGQIDRLGNRAVLAGGAVAYGLNRTVVRTAAEFERFEAVLGTIEGSSEKAKISMGWVTEFAAKTPYELAEVTSSFVKLKSYGIDPQSGALRAAGDAAAAMGKPLEQAVEALADAMTGENERLKEFGITTETVGNKIVYRWQQNGQTMVATAKKSSQEQIQAVLTGIWNSRYGGAMDNLAGTWDGMMSNLGDSWTVFQKDVMDSGGFAFVKAELKGLLDEIQRMKDTGEYDELVNTVGTELTEAFKAVKSAVVEVRNTARELQPTLEAVGQAVSKVVELGGGASNIAKWLGVLYLVNKSLRMLSVAAPVGKAAWGAGSWAAGKVFNRGKGSDQPAGRPGTAGMGGMMKLPLPVYVVNKHMSLTPDQWTGSDTPPPSSKGERTPRRAGRFARGVESVAQAGRNVGSRISTPKGAGVAGVVIEGAMLVPTLMADDVSNADKVTATGGALGGMGGAWAGATAGAALGSLVPVIGTAVGGIVGGILGGFGGDWLGTLAAEKINSELDVKVTVEGPPGTKANVSDMKATGTDLNAEVYNGAGMAMP